MQAHEGGAADPALDPDILEGDAARNPGNQPWPSTTARPADGSTCGGKRGDSAPATMPMMIWAFRTDIECPPRSRGVLSAPRSL
eukprot:CAMPEP_0177539176 /NCGR_PEP_ID=MMETSP0369-20130122/58816_1 /TAXON_ID=447022 ORGANISM="Scrippsiella hangoei-like, Strain SHHI-4" /NCGR_SAMPLE_ID=MMETSP0369 /ASSEMBLY_ACC=CAM_ASM_000364 /LENGTH=83 /DNA_ID=CAMNT_0019022127 /DNA_START=598 /DNA_END=847 /DNA_ORIENTATION=-